jgi:hypothetical protein
VDRRAAGGAGDIEGGAMRKLIAGTAVALLMLFGGAVRPSPGK